MTFDLTDEDRENLEGCRVVASVSGGKDSAALSLWLTEQGIDHDRVFADTGWEHPATYEYLRGLLTDAVGPIAEVQCSKGGFADVARWKQMMPSRLRRFCTTHLKVLPIAHYLESATELFAVNATGIRAAESRYRAMLTRWEACGWFDGMSWRPLLDWTEQDVIDIHQRHSLVPSPLYLRGASRVGCWPCIFSRKAEIRLVADLSPERIDEIRELERELGCTFFHGHKKAGTPTPIDEVVEWSRTDYGGKQMLMFDKEPPGCVRWGMCEGHGEAS